MRLLLHCILFTEVPHSITMHYNTNLIIIIIYNTDKKQVNVVSMFQEQAYAVDFLTTYKQAMTTEF